jgi:hypothetical protein
MSRNLSPIVVDPTDPDLLPGTRPARDHQELWVAIVRNRWGSVVLVPADAAAPAAAIATSLAELASRVSPIPVQAIVAEPLDYALVAQRVASCGTRQAGPQRAASAAERVIVAVRPVVAEPLGVTVALAADAAVVVAELGRTRLADIRRTVELLGRERLAGCVLLRR